MILCLYTIVQIVCLLPIRSFIYLTAKYIHGNSNTVSKSFCYTGSQRFNMCNLDRKAIHFASEVISGAICQTSTQSSRLIATTTCVPHCPISVSGGRRQSRPFGSWYSTGTASRLYGWLGTFPVRYGGLQSSGGQPRCPTFKEKETLHLHGWILCSHKRSLSYPQTCSFGHRGTGGSTHPCAWQLQRRPDAIHLRRSYTR